MNAKNRLMEALEQLLREKPIDEISVSNLAAQADVGRNTFYRLYSDKFELLKDYYSDRYVVLFDDVSDPLALNEATLVTLTRFLENQQVVHHMFFSKDGFALKAFFRDICIETNMRFWESRGADVSDERVQGAIRLYSYGTASFLLEWIKSGMRGDLKVVADQFALAVPAVLVAPELSPSLMGKRVGEASDNGSPS